MGLFFIIALQFTSAANALATYGTGPLWTLVFGLLFYGERPTLHATLMTCVGFSFVMVVFAGSVAESKGTMDLRGDFFGLLSGVCIASWMLLNRHSAEHSVRSRTTNFLGACFCCVFGLVLTSGNIVPWRGSHCACVDGAAGWVYIALDGGILMPISLWAATVAPKYIPAGEVALIFLGDTFLGTIWVWMVLGEVPSLYAMVGGVGLLSTLAAHILTEMWASNEKEEMKETTRAETTHEAG